MSYPLGAVILAAGLSSRMRSFKPLLTMGEGSVLERIVKIFQHADITPVVVTGHNHTEIEALAQKLKVETVHNPAYEEGMFTSVQRGLGHMANRPCGGVFLLPTDIPLVRFSTLVFMQAEFSQNRDKYDLWYPVYRGRKGHPPLLKIDLVKEIAALPPDNNLRDVLSAVPAARKAHVDVCDKYILRDMDYPAEYVALLDEFDGYDVLSPAEAYVLLKKMRGNDERLIKHSLKVMLVALRIGLALRAKRAKVDLKLIQSSALLHDIGKGQPNHACFAAEILASLELPRMGYVAGCHSGFALSCGLYEFLGKDELSAKVVYIADKYVGSDSGDYLVSLNERFDASMRRFGDNPEAARNIKKYRKEAHSVHDEISGILGKPLEELIFTGEKH